MTRLGALAKALTATGPLDARARWVLGALDIRLDIRFDAGSERLSAPGGSGGTGTLIVANHLSWLDIVALLTVEPVTFLAKREVARWPFLGPLAARHGTLFVDRWALRALPDSVAEVARHLRAGHSVAVFPEATTWCSAHGGPFRRAVFQAALDVGAPVRPVTISYLQGGKPSTIASFVGDDTLARSVGRVAKARDLTLRLHMAPTLEPRGDRRLLAGQARQAVLAAEPAHA